MESSFRYNIRILSQDNVEIDDDDSKCFDQLQNLKCFLNNNEENVDFKKLLAYKKWVTYFNPSLRKLNFFLEFDKKKYTWLS